MGFYASPENTKGRASRDPFKDLDKARDFAERRMYRGDAVAYALAQVRKCPKSGTKLVTCIEGQQKAPDIAIHIFMKNLRKHSARHDGARARMFAVLVDL